MTRLLSPEDFGVVAIMTIFIAVGEALLEGGMGQSLIQDEDCDDTDFSTVFFMNMGMSLVLYAMLFFASPWIASFFSRPILVPLIRVYGLVYVISASMSVQRSILRKRMQFKKLTFSDLPGTALGAICGIFMAYNGYGVWSLIGLQLSSKGLRSVFLWISSSWYPSIKLSKDKFLKHWNFGYKLMVSNIIGSTFRELNSFFIGRWFSVTMLGFYGRARSLTYYPINTVTQIIAKVSYPLLSTVKSEKERVLHIYKLILRSLFFLVTPVMLSAAVVAKPLFILLFTEKWLPAVPYFQVIVLSGILYPVNNFNRSVFKVFNRTDLLLKVTIINRFVSLFAIAMGFWLGIYGLLWTTVAATYGALIVNMYYSESLIGYKTIHQLKDMMPTWILGFSSAAGGYILLRNLQFLSYMVQIITVAPAIIMTYWILNFIFKNPSYSACKSMVSLFLDKKKVDQKKPFSQ